MYRLTLTRRLNSGNGAVQDVLRKYVDVAFLAKRRGLLRIIAIVEHIVPIMVCIGVWNCVNSV